MSPTQRRTELGTRRSQSRYRTFESYPFVWWDAQSQNAFEAEWSAPVPEDLASLLPKYTRAHSLLPPSPTTMFDPAMYRRHQARALERLQRHHECSTENTLLRAILILGHCGTEAAMDGLTEFCRTGHELVGLANLALVECAELWCLEMNVRQDFPSAV